MLELTRRPRTDGVPLEAECIVPDQLASLTAAAIERLAVANGNRTLPLAEFFQVRGDPADEEIRIIGDCSRIKWIGRGMRSGRILVDGDAGMHLGAEIAGGEITVQGNVGDWVGAEMQGGSIFVRGNAGGMVGAVYRGGKLGMRGGVILIKGRAGVEVGGRMRRGLIAVGGDCGDFAGVSMLAGTIMIFGNPGVRLGAGMKRGTIALFRPSQTVPSLLPTFRYDCDYSPTVMRLYVMELTRRGFPAAEEYFAGGCFSRFNGDLLELGKGEILVWRKSSENELSRQAVAG